MWCSEHQLRVNPSKSEAILFTKKRLSPGLKPVNLFNQPVPMVNQVKYLGVILDKKLTWKPHIDNKIQKALGVLWLSRRAIGKAYGLSPTGFIPSSYALCFHMGILYGGLGLLKKLHKLNLNVFKE